MSCEFSITLYTKNITIDYDWLSSLPSEGIPSELHQIECIENNNDKEIDSDRGPRDVNETPFNEESEKQTQSSIH